MVDLAVSVEEEVTSGPLTLFPLVASSPAEGEAVLLAGPTAAEEGLLTVRECDEGAVVGELVVTSGAEVPVLLIEGETVLGAKQNRTLNVSVLVAAGAELVVPVSCVEQGRWGDERTTVRSRHHSPTTLRAAKTRSVNHAVRTRGDRTSDQGEVWREVETYLATFEVDSASAALEDVVEARQPAADDLVAGLVPAAGQVGMITAVGGRVQSLDCFERPEVLAAYWGALVLGAALDGLAVGETDAAASRDEAEAFLVAVQAAECQRSAAVGLGQELHLDGAAVTGIGLEWRHRVQHLAAFAVDGPGSGADLRQAATARTRPIRRRR